MFLNLCDRSWTMTLLADEPQARRAFRANRCFPRLLKLTSTKAESVVEAVCQLLARLAYDGTAHTQSPPQLDFQACL